jgi:hypothetical protein
MTSVAKAWTYFLVAISLLMAGYFLLPTDSTEARNILEYKDLISDSGPLKPANHTLSFKIDTDVSPGAYIDISLPPDFELLSTGATFSEERNVELSVNGTTRDSGSILTSLVDMVEITSGNPGSIRYTLNTSTGIISGSRLEFKIGNHTSESLPFSESFSTTTGATTTIQADIKPIINAPTEGTKRVMVEVHDGGLVADAGFLIALVNRVGVGPIDTTEEIPPFRFNGAPSSTITGVTLNVELYLETDELAICRYDIVPGTDYYSMTRTFTGTGLIYHTQVVPVTPDSLQSFYIRCIDDEANFNIDDYLIEFYVSATPTGSSTTEGDVDGDGTGTGSTGSGDGGGAGGTTGSGGGNAPTTGGSSGSGGSGGGGGGGSGSANDSTAGGGFESTDGPFRSGDARVVITGFAFPGSTVSALVDGKVVTDVRAGGDGSYSITVDKIARGVYTFGVFAVDSARVRSSTFSTSFTVTGARTSALSNINLAPTIRVTPDPVDPGVTLNVSGFAIPNSTITIENEKDKSAPSRQTFTATADGNGAWSTTIPTNNFSVGTYKIRAKSEQTGGLSTNFSNYTLYGVGQAAAKPLNADLNRDGKINLIDFSILLFWWGTNGGDSDPSADINGDTRVNLTDFSILLFNWTG